MRKFLRVVMLVAVLVAGGLALSLFGTYRASQHVPAFYEKAIRLEPVAQAQAGDELERQVLELHNEARQEGEWQAVFTDEQINGWLAVDLPAKFPDALPAEVREPRVAIDPQQIQIACRYDAGAAKTVVSLALEIKRTDEPNVVAVRIRQVRAGLLPLPLKQGIDRITVAAREAGIPLRWAQKEGDPVALVTLPMTHEQFGKRQLKLRTIQLRDGEIHFSGSTEAGDPASEGPQG